MVSLFLSSPASGGLPLTHRALVCRIRQPCPLISASRFYRLSSVPSPPILLWRYPRFSPSRPRLLLSRPPSGVGCGAHEHHHHYHHQHQHGHEHTCELELNGVQKAILRFAKAVGWVDLADLLRDHLQLCCCSMVLLLLSAACPYFLPARVAKLLQNAFISIAFPLIGVCLFSASLDDLVARILVGMIAYFFGVIGFWIGSCLGSVVGSVMYQTLGKAFVDLSPKCWRIIFSL